MEEKERKDKKIEVQNNIKQMLDTQIQGKQDNRDSELRKDKEFIDESNRLNEIEKAKARDKMRQMRQKLQEMNRERDQTIKQRNEEDRQFQMDMQKFSKKLVDLDNEAAKKEKQD